MMGNRALMVLCVTAIAVTLGAAWLMNERDRAERRETFLRLCAEAGFDRAKCAFFLVASEAPNGPRALSTIIGAGF